jgi:predicted AlkP superfamily pyrophosphatase or phosphodiesterase
MAWDSLQDALTSVAREIELATSPTYTYVYVPFVDHAQHVDGPGTPSVARALEQVQDHVARFADSLPERSRLVVTADHGVIAIDRRYQLSRTDPMMSLLRFPPSGEPRAPYFHVRDGNQTRFADAFRDRWSNAFALLSTQEAAEAGLFGSAGVEEETRSRLGDFIAIALEKDVLFFEPSKELAAMKGTHGGMQPDEMRIPLIVV